jgi:hypothetical protein
MRLATEKRREERAKAAITEAGASAVLAAGSGRGKAGWRVF